jgi:hypothetical protein
MPKFFFHVVNGDFIPDTQGIKCKHLDEAKSQAVRVAGEMLRDQGLALWRTRHYDMFVCDEANKTRLKLSFTVEDLGCQES